MKIAFSTTGDDLSAPLESRFGRAPKFLVYDLEAETFTVIDNQQNMNAAQGAGIQSANAVIQSGAGILMTGHCGPKAFRVLQEAGLKVFNLEAPTISAALEQYRSGKVQEASTPDVSGHW